MNRRSISLRRSILHPFSCCSTNQLALLHGLLLSFQARSLLLQFPWVSIDRSRRLNSKGFEPIGDLLDVHLKIRLCLTSPIEDRSFDLLDGFDCQSTISSESQNLQLARLVQYVISSVHDRHTYSVKIFSAIPMVALYEASWLL